MPSKMGSRPLSMLLQEGVHPPRMFYFWLIMLSSHHLYLRFFRMFWTNLFGNNSLPKDTMKHQGPAVVIIHYIPDQWGKGARHLAGSLCTSYRKLVTNLFVISSRTWKKCHWNRTHHGKEFSQKNIVQPLLSSARQHQGTSYLVVTCGFVLTSWI